MRSTTRPRRRCRTPSASPRSRRRRRPSRSRTTSMPEPRIISFREALREAMVEEMERDPSIFLMGEEVGHYNGAYKVSEGMLARFGEARVIDTPIAETGFAGVGIGAAMIGLRPIIEFMTWNFSLTAIDQLVNNAAKLRYMANGQFTLPIVFRGPGGAAHALAAQHSQALEALDAGRREGAAQGGHPRRQPGLLHRERGDVRAQGRGARRRARRPARRRGGEAAGARCDARHLVEDGAYVPRGRRGAGARRHRGRGARPAHHSPARR